MATTRVNSWRAMPTARVTQYHIAGHYDEADDLKVDTHGAPVKDDVWALLDHAYALHGVRPTLLERDFNFPRCECCWRKSSASARSSAAMSDALREQQLAFAAHLRDPANNAAPDGIEDRRMAIYRDLFFNSIQGLLAANFPVIRKTLGDTPGAAWCASSTQRIAPHAAVHRSGQRVRRMARIVIPAKAGIRRAAPEQ